MSLAKFDFTARARPIVQLGVGDTRIPVGTATWDTARWDQAAYTWAGTEPVWHDITCDTNSYRCEYGRKRTTERFVPGVATVTVDNATGWADPNVVADTNVLTVRPGRPIRMGVEHKVYGVRWLFRGFVDAVIPVYDPTNPDSVQLDCVDALGEVNRAKFVTQPVDGTGETITDRINRILNLANWAPTKRDLSPTADTLIADDLAGQAADLLGQAADSGGGSVFGDLEARIAFRPRDWQVYPPGTPVDGTIGNVPADTGQNRVTFGEFNYLWFGDQVVEGVGVAGGADVCPTRWERPFNRADIATRVIMGREGDPSPVGTVLLDDIEGQLLYGIEPFERTDLLTEQYELLLLLAQRVLHTRGHTEAPRVRSVTLNAATATNALDLMSTVDVYKPSRYRCRLEYDRGMVFDEEYFATAVAHDVTPTGWTLELNLDTAAPYAQIGSRWDTGLWDTALWAISGVDRHNPEGSTRMTKPKPTQQAATPTPLLDAHGNPGNVAPGELVEASWGNAVVGRVIHRFPNKIAMDAYAAVQGSLAVTTDQNFVWFRDTGVWKPTSIGRVVNFRLTGNATGQTLAPSTAVTAAFNIESDDFNVVSAGVFTVPVGFAGRWVFDWSVDYPAGTGLRQVWLQAQGVRNGLTTTAGETGFQTDISGTVTMTLPELSPVALQMFHTHSAPLLINASTNHYFQGRYEGMAP